MRWSCVAGTVLLALLLSGARGLRAQSVTPLPKLDLDHLRGTWYEIARYPTKSEKGCVRDAYELIAFGNGKGSLQFVDACRGKENDPQLKSMSARQNKSGAGQLKVRHLVLFSKKYDVLALAQDDSWALLGRTDHKELWVLSKTPVLAPALLANIEAQATAQGFSPAKLIMTPQDVPPAS